MSPHGRDFGVEIEFTNASRPALIEALLDRDLPATEELARTVGRFKVVKTHAIARHGTFEFRSYEGTLDYARLSAWVRFGQTLMRDGLNTDAPLLVDHTMTAAAFLLRLGMSEVDRTALLTPTTIAPRHLMGN